MNGKLRRLSGTLECPIESIELWIPVNAPHPICRGAQPKEPDFCTSHFFFRQPIRV